MAFFARTGVEMGILHARLEEGLHANSLKHEATILSTASGKESLHLKKFLREASINSHPFYMALSVLEGPCSCNTCDGGVDCLLKERRL